MCGICGKLVFKDVIPSTCSIRKMCSTLMHRGPDDEGIYTAPHIGLGQRRLSVIDLNSKSCPPLSNEDGSLWLVFNGEIYNYQTLRLHLIERGHLFSTKSDTEVILHLYEEYGVDCLNHLNGMFAFALWDSNSKKLFCARDRLGKKPLCFALTSDSFLFGSEIKAIMANHEFSAIPNYHALDLYLTHKFVPSPVTAFEGIEKLGPGEYLICDLRGKISKYSYWQPTLVLKTSSSKEAIEDELLNRLRSAVKLRMISDVPLGAFLSGGVDSATIVALMAMESSKAVKTFSIGFENENINELPYARMVADRYGTDHHEIIIKPNIADILQKLVWHYNEPFADSSALPTYHISSVTREHVTVALSGDGGDESFAGYDSYSALLRWQRWNTLPYRLRSKSSTVLRSFLESFSSNNQLDRFRRGLAMLGAANIKERRLQYSTILKPEEKRQAYTPLFKELLANSSVLSDPLDAYPWTEGMEDLDWLMRHDQRYYLPDCLMVKSDIASMANGLEVRSPFLDYEFVEFSSTIPGNYKLDSNGGKVILKNAVRNLLPPTILNKPKTGFGLPLRQWFRKDLAPLLRATLLDDMAIRRGFFETQFIKKMISEHQDGSRDWSNRLWAFLFLELWFREFID